jgi:hypothetical protein
VQPSATAPAAAAAAAAAGGDQWMEMTRDLELATLCEHHLLPFHGAVHVAYVHSGGGGGGGGDSPQPAPTPLPRSALQAIVTRHGRRLQVQERLTRDIARDVQAATARGLSRGSQSSTCLRLISAVLKPLCYHRSDHVNCRVSLESSEINVNTVASPSS